MTDAERIAAKVMARLFTEWVIAVGDAITEGTTDAVHEARSASDALIEQFAALFGDDE